jgi:sarcosine oxidase subunit alpha
MAGVRGLSPLVANFARRVAGLGTLADHAPPVARAERAEVSVLIVGGGRRGLALAAQLGGLAMLADDGPELGGALLALDPPRALALRDLARASGARVLSRTCVVALSREPEDGTGRLTALLVGAAGTLVVRAATVVLATGRHDAVPAFPNNDLPGIFSARAALTAWRGDVLLGSRLAVVGSGRYAEGLLQQMSGAVELIALDETSVVRAVGRDRISAVEVRAEGKSRRIKVDALAFDGRGAPSFELAAQAGASVDFEPEAGYFPRADADGKVAERVYVPHGDPRVTVAALRDRLG